MLLEDGKDRYMLCSFFAQSFRSIEKGISYAEMVRKSKWTSKGIDAGIIREEGDTIVIDGKTDKICNELLARSLIGSLPANGSEPPILSEVRRWACKNWNQAHGLNIYEMGQNRFLFEFQSITAAEHVLKGRWFWMNQCIQLQWWSPTVGAISSRAEVNQSRSKTGRHPVTSVVTKCFQSSRRFLW